MLIVLADFVLCGRNFYRILKVPRNATVAEIKKAYRKQSARFHPDRAEDEDEKMAFEMKQLELNDAIGCLQNARKRAVYDKAQFTTGMGEEAVKAFEEQKQPDAYQGRQIDIHDQDFDPMLQIDYKEKAAPKQLVRRLSFAQCMAGVFEDFAYQRRMVCHHCNGSRAESPEDVRNCSHCSGRGRWSEEVEYLPRKYGHLERFCEECNGTGTKIVRRCKRCHGKGMVEETASVKLIVRSGVYSGYVEKFEDAGDQTLKDPHLPPGDLEVSIECDEKAEVNGLHFHRRGQDILTTLRITLREALFGFRHEIQLPDLHVVTVSSDSLVQNGEIITVKGGGMAEYRERRAGDLLVEIYVELNEGDK